MLTVLLPLKQLIEMAFVRPNQTNFLLNIYTAGTLLCGRELINKREKQEHFQANLPGNNFDQWENSLVRYWFTTSGELLNVAAAVKHQTNQGGNATISSYLSLNWNKTNKLQVWKQPKSQCVCWVMQDQSGKRKTNVAVTSITENDRTSNLSFGKKILSPPVFTELFLLL